MWVKQFFVIYFVFFFVCWFIFYHFFFSLGTIVGAASSSKLIGCGVVSGNVTSNQEGGSVCGSSYASNFDQCYSQKEVNVKGGKIKIKSYSKK